MDDKLLIQITTNEHEPRIRELLTEYAQWLKEMLEQKYKISIDADATLQSFMEDLEAFFPPHGRIFLSQFNGKFVGIGCLKQLDNNVGEIKRIFVKPEYRGKGIGKLILERLIAEARSIGYKQVRLDSPKFSIEVHRLYQSMGFQYIEPYSGSGGAKAQTDNVVYMELVL